MCVSSAHCGGMEPRNVVLDQQRGKPNKTCLPCFAIALQGFRVLSCQNRENTRINNCCHLKLSDVVSVQGRASPIQSSPAAIRFSGTAVSHERSRIPRQRHRRRLCVKPDCLQLSFPAAGTSTVVWGGTQLPAAPVHKGGNHERERHAGNTPAGVSARATQPPAAALQAPPPGVVITRSAVRHMLLGSCSSGWKMCRTPSATELFDR